MFKEIEKELLSIISDEPFEAIANRPDSSVGKTMELIYNIKYEDLKRAYKTEVGNLVNLTIIYDAKDRKSIDFDLCPIDGKVHHIIFFPESLLDKSENNAIVLSRAIITYISCRVALLMDEYESVIKRIDDNDNKLYLTILQSIPIITCSIMRRIYNGSSLSKIIYMSLTELMDLYKTLYTEEGIDTIMDLLITEDLSVELLLDNGFICAIKYDNSKYPGIWGTIKEE